VQFETFAIASDEPMAGDDKPEIYWLVDDAMTAFQELSSKAEIALPSPKSPSARYLALKIPMAGRVICWSSPKKGPAKAFERNAEAFRLWSFVLSHY